MISTLSKQAGRRYPQMRPAWSAHARLDAVGESSGSATLIGQWSNVIQCTSANARIECQSANKRIECYASNERLET